VLLQKKDVVVIPLHFYPFNGLIVLVGLPEGDPAFQLAKISRQQSPNVLCENFVGRGLTC